MRLLSLMEPWATLMALQAKRIETRDWATVYRGPLAIHASKGGLSLQDLLDTCTTEPFFSALQPYEPFAEATKNWHSMGLHKSALKEAFPHKGHILCVVNLTDCLTTEHLLKSGKVSEQERAFGNYEPLRFGWMTEFIYRLPEPIPFTSKLGLVDVGQDIRDELKRQFRMVNL